MPTRHDENVLPKVVLSQTGYGIATWQEQSVEEQCDWIKRYLYENDDCCLGKEQKATRKTKVHRWTKAHKQGNLAYSNHRAVEIYYEHYQVKHSLREKDRRCAELRTRLDVKEQIYWDEVAKHEEETDRLKKQLEEAQAVILAMSGDSHHTRAVSVSDSKVVIDRARYRKLMRIHNWVKDKRGQTLKIIDRDQSFVD